MNPRPARSLALLLGLALTGPAFAGGTQADRGLWDIPPGPDAPVVDQHDGWTIPGPRRRAVQDRWGYGQPKASALKRAAEDGDVYDLVFLGDAYMHGHAYWAGIEPDLTGAKNALVGALHGLKPKPARAERYYRRAVASGVKNTLPYTRLALYLLDQGGDRAEAIGLLRQAAQAGSPWAMLRLADELRRDGEPSTSWRPWLERAADHPVFPEPGAQLRLIGDLLDAGQVDAALTRFANLAYRVGQDPDIGDLEPLEALVEARVERVLRERAQAGDASASQALEELLRWNGHYSYRADKVRRGPLPFVDPATVRAVLADLRAWETATPAQGLVDALPE